ncbi:MAG: hypothetical protein AAF078_09635, partial [Planctomycetota bacterium]
MQLMTWQIARLGSRFGLTLEPYRRRVLHSAMGRFLDAPLDLAVGLVEPGGVERVLPFTQDGELLNNCEMFDRVNSVTYRGYSERYRLRLELNLHATFYPQHEALSLLPALFVEVRVNPSGPVRWHKQAGQTPEAVELFVRLKRGETELEPWSDHEGRPGLAMRYAAPLTPRLDQMHAVAGGTPADVPAGGVVPATVAAEERLVSLNDAATATALEGGGAEMRLKLPVTREGSGTKWRMVWAAHVSEPVLYFADGPKGGADATRAKAEDATAGATFKYAEHWARVEDVVIEAIKARDDALALSRRFEKVLEQARADDPTVSCLRDVWP